MRICRADSRQEGNESASLIHYKRKDMDEKWISTSTM